MIKNDKITRANIVKLVTFLILYLITFALIFSYFLLTPTYQPEYPIIRTLIIAFASVLLIKYVLYMIVSPWHDVSTLWQRVQKLRTQKKQRRYNPKVSVLIPAWNEEDGVITTAKALLKSTYHNLEIIIINNASTDNTEKNIKKLITKQQKSQKNSDKNKNRTLTQPKIVYEFEPQSGKGFALNKGLKRASGQIIITIDADCFVPPSTIANFVTHFRDSKVMAAVGNVKIGNTQTLVGVVQYLEFLFSFYFKKADSLVDVIYIIGGAAGAYRKQVFRKIGGYSTTNITEDIDLSVRIQDAGMKIVYAADAVVYTEGASELTGLMKQRLRWKRGRLETFAEHRHLFFSADTNHNKLLSWFILPLAIFGEAQLSLEMVFLLFLYVYSYFSQDFTSFYSGIIVVSSMFIIQAVFDKQRQDSKKILLLAPIGWLLFYISTFVELNALINLFGVMLVDQKLSGKTGNAKAYFK